MTRGSLRVRLSIAAAALIALALFIAGFGLFYIFNAALDRRTADELNHTAKLLAGGVGIDAKGDLTIDQKPADPRFATPYGGLYWEIESAGKAALRSRSLWDRTIRLPPLPTSQMAHHQTIDQPGFDGGQLISVFRTVQIVHAPGAPLVLITVAMDRRQIAASRALVLLLLPPSLFSLAAILSLAMTLFVSRALRPFRTLQLDLHKVHAGDEDRLRGTYPSEVQPLVDDLNRLVAQQERALARAKTQAADMAHGLKTPLAILDALARRIRDEHPTFAVEIDQQSLEMQEQIARTLARSRTAAAAAAGLHQYSTPVAPVVDRLVSAMKRLPDAEHLTWRIESGADLTYPASEGDLFEMLGNLVDNARKWARREITVTITGSTESGAIAIEDDGPGLNAAAMTAIGRGQRWDESVAGTGFGLAITKDLAEATGGQLKLDERPEGGLRVAIGWQRNISPSDAPLQVARSSRTTRMTRTISPRPPEPYPRPELPP